MLELDVQADPGTLSSNEIERLITQTLQAERTELDRVSVSFVDKHAMTELNTKHRGQPKPTDVLSYPFDKSFPQGNGGAVVICPAVAEAHAKRHGQALADELRLLVVHGVLHLLGHEDETEAGRQAMERKAREILGSTHGS